MKIANTPLKKAILVAVGSIAILVIAVIVVISPIARYLVEKYDEKLINRTSCGT
jgi:hypothetical protein